MLLVIEDKQRTAENNKNKIEKRFCHTQNQAYLKPNKQDQELAERKCRLRRKGPRN